MKNQPPEAIGEGADAALAPESGVMGVIDGDEASIDGLLAIELGLLAVMSGAGVVVAAGAGVSDVFEQPVNASTAVIATAESVEKELIRVIVSSCPDICEDCLPA